MKMNVRLQQVRREVALLFMVLLTAAVYAVPAKPGLTRQLTLTDGTTVTATLVGDEHGHYWLDADGQAYQATERADAFQLVDKADVTMRAQARRSAANQHRIRNLAPRRVGDVGAIIGKKKGLIILVNFSNVSFQSANDNALYQRIANEKNFSYGKFKGSMYDYFYAQSDGQFELTFDVVGPVTVSNTQSYYGSNDSSGNDKYPAEMVIEALKLVDSKVNFADYDWDGDGEVEQVYVVYAGKGEADGGASTTIWPHEWNLSSASYYGDGDGSQALDGVTINTYACGGELNGRTGTIAGIGTMCHEFSHCLGYPDFYDTDYSGGQGMGYWDLMDSGSYNGDGYQPAGYTSYERWVAGWKEPVELEVTQSITNMKTLTNGGESYVIYNQGNTNEYFLLENRQKSGWDAGIPGAGLLILHVDYDKTIWANNKPNDTPSRQRMTWIAADNEYQYTTYQGTKYYSEEGMANDPFPYGSVNAFNKSTTPAAKFYNKNTDGTYYLDSSVEEITRNADGTISFRFKGLINVATPKFSPAADRYQDPQTISITCATEGAAIYYTLDGTTPSASSTLYSQPITISETTTIKAVAVLDGEESKVASAKYVISSSLLYEGVSEYASRSDGYLELSLDDEVLDYEGWATFSKVYAGGTGNAYANGGCLKLGSSRAIGSLTTKAISLNGDATLTFWLKRYSSDAGQLKVSVNGAAADVTSFSPSATWTPCTVNLTRAQGSIIITFSTSSKRVYLDEIELVPLHNSRQEISMAFSENSVTAILGQAFTPPTLTISPEGLPVSYSSSNANVATVDSETGEVSILAVGATVITASFAGNDDYYGNSASYTLTVSEPPTYYELVTDVTMLAEGDEVLIAYVSEEACKALGTNQKPNNREAVDVTLNDDETLTPSSDTQVITLEKDNTNFLFNVGTGYLYAASSSNNYLKTGPEADDNAKATISINNGDATITFQGKNTRNTMRYNPNNGTPLFSCYASTSSTGSLPQIYRRIVKPVFKGDVNDDGEVTIADAVALVNYLLSQSTDEFNEKAAYVDDDDAITISDALAIVNMILNQ